MPTSQKIARSVVAGALSAVLAPVFAAGAQTTQPPAQPVPHKHHSVLVGAAAGAAAGSAIPGHRHPILGALAGAEVQHHRNKTAKREAKRAARAQAQAQSATPSVP